MIAGGQWRQRHNRSRQFGKCLWGLLLACGLLCAPPTGQWAAAQPTQGGTIVYAVHESMPNFDIHYEATYIAVQPIAPLYNGLLTLDVYQDYRIVGDLAEGWDVAPDGKKITFTLRQGVKFHDGSEFNCADAKYSIEKLADPKRAHEAFFSVLQPVFAAAACPDKATLVLTLKQPSAALLTMLAGANAVMMKAGIAEQVDRKDAKFLIGTGPFQYKSSISGVDFQAERNPNYWRPGLPHIDGYRAVVMADLTKIFASFRAKQLTMTGIGRHLEKPEADILQRDFPDGVVAIGPRATWDNFVMNLTKPPFNDVRVRKAVALATDREKMIEIAVEGWGLLGGYIGPHTPFSLALEELKKYPQFSEDMQKRQAEAKKLLAEAGYANGLEVELLLRRGPLYERGALSRQDDLKKVGINVKIILLDTAAIRDRTEKGDFQVYTIPAAVQFDDPDQYYARFLCDAAFNRGGYCNRDYDKLYQEQSQTFDLSQRADITRKMERILLQDIPDDRGYYWKATMGYWNRVKQWPPLQGTTVYNFGRFEQVWCQDGKCM